MHLPWIGTGVALLAVGILIVLVSLSLYRSESFQSRILKDRNRFRAFFRQPPDDPDKHRRGMKAAGIFGLFFGGLNLIMGVITLIKGLGFG
jgi:hypothetical protein